MGNGRTNELDHVSLQGEIRKAAFRSRRAEKGELQQGPRQAQSPSVHGPWPFSMDTAGRWDLHWASLLAFMRAASSGHPCPSEWGQGGDTVLYSPESHPCLSPSGAVRACGFEFYYHPPSLRYLLTSWVLFCLSLFSPFLVLYVLLFFPISPDASLGILIARIRVTQSVQTCMAPRPVVPNLRTLLLFHNLRLLLSPPLCLPLSSQAKICSFS